MKQILSMERLDRRILLSATPNDPLINNQWNIASTSLTQAWQTTTGSKNVVVAVIDSGIDLKHPDLMDNLWKNPGEIAGDGIDNDKNGYVDDVNGWNFVNWNGNVQDRFGHGTFVSSIIGAKGNNNIGIAGINWNVSIMALKFMADNGVGYTAAAGYAIEYAVQMKTKFGVNIVAINASFGGGTNYSSFVLSAIQHANSAGITFVSAAGNSANNNDSNPTYPSCYDSPNVISVGGLNSDNTLGGYSNYGKVNVDLAAPGSSVYGAWPNGGYGYGTGTSFAAPQVTGAVALLNSVKPNITVSEVKAAIFGSVDKLSSLADKTLTGGKLNIANAVALARLGSPIMIPIGVKLGNVQVGYTKLGYALSSNNSVPIQIRSGVSYVSISNPGGGWTIMAARTISNGYEIFWKHASGSFCSWNVNNAGSYVSYKMLRLRDILTLESQYGVDMNGDKSVGLLFTSFGASINNIQIGITQLGYAIRSSGGNPVLITYNNNYISQNYPGGGWVITGARAVGSGYELFWKNNISKQYASWSLTSSGTMVGWKPMSLSQIVAIENTYKISLR